MKGKKEAFTLKPPLFIGIPSEKVKGEGFLLYYFINSDHHNLHSDAS